MRGTSGRGRHGGLRQSNHGFLFVRVTRILKVPRLGDGVGR